PSQTRPVGINVHCLFLFQAEDGIRDDLVTGVQTCALPISSSRAAAPRLEVLAPAQRLAGAPLLRIDRGDRADRSRGHRARGVERSEERRVGKGGGARGGRELDKCKRVTGGVEAFWSTSVDP